MLKLLEKRERLIREIEQHFNMSALEVAENKKLSKDEFFIVRDREIERIDNIIETEMF